MVAKQSCIHCGRVTLALLVATLVGCVTPVNKPTSKASAPPFDLPTAKVAVIGDYCFYKQGLALNPGRVLQRESAALADDLTGISARHLRAHGIDAQAVQVNSVCHAPWFEVKAKTHWDGDVIKSHTGYPVPRGGAGDGLALGPQLVALRCEYVAFIKSAYQARDRLNLHDSHFYRLHTCKDKHLDLSALQSALSKHSHLLLAYDWDRRKTLGGYLIELLGGVASASPGPGGGRVNTTGASSSVSDKPNFALFDLRAGKFVWSNPNVRESTQVCQTQNGVETPEFMQRYLSTLVCQG